MRLGLCACVLVVASVARADGGDATRAKALFDDGRKLIEAADKTSDPAGKASSIDAACTKFTASITLDPQLGTKLNLADCRQRQGKLFEAYAVLVDAAAEAARVHDREAFARDQLAAVAAKLVRVTLHVADPDVRGMTIRIAGRAVPRKEWTQERVFLPGAIVVDVAAPGHTPIRISHDGAAGATVVLEVPALAAAEVTTEPPIVDAPPARSKVPYVVIGVGGASIVTSIVLGLHARSRYETAKDADDVAGVTSAQHEADLGTVFVAAGAVVAAVGIWLYVHDTPDRTTVTATLTGNQVGFAVLGHF